MTEFIEIFGYRFFQNALWAAVLTSLIASMVGTYIVSRKIVFIGGGITHASFGGIGMAYFFGLNPFLGAAVFGILSALGIEWISTRGKVSEDSAIAILWSLGMALGIIFIFLTPGYSPNLMSFLFGSILSVGRMELWFLTGFFIILATVFAIYFRPILYTAFDPEFARISGVPVNVFRYLMSVVVALAIVISIRTIGIILVLSVFTIPQLTAMRFTRDFSRIIPLSAFWGITGSVAGLIMAYLLDIPAGASMIFFLIVQYLVVRFLTRTKKSKIAKN